MFVIRQDDPSDPELAALVDDHLAEMHMHSPACKVHAMPSVRLAEPDITFWSIRRDGVLAGCGALKELDRAHGEIKSMRVAKPFLRQGAGEAMLLHILAEARARGYARISLETGRPAFFAPAQRLYAKHGFSECPPFGDYVSDEFSMCMSRPL